MQGGDKPQETGFSKKFDKCPVCGSTERYYEGLLKRMQERGFIDKKITCFDFQQHTGVPLPPEKIATLPFGSSVPQFTTVWDCCLGCGAVYSALIQELEVKKSIEVANSPLLPNRAERRRVAQGQVYPWMNNPSLS